MRVTREADLAEADLRLWRAARADHVEVRLVERTERAGAGEERSIERHWRELRAQNTRLHDARILSVRSLNPDAGRLECTRDRFRRLVVQPRVKSGVCLLGVTGVLWWRAEGGDARVVMIRRGEQTRIYPSLWEIGPSGGVDPPAGAVDRLTRADVLGALRAEAGEELGVAPEWTEARIVAYLHDTRARSLDIVLACALREPVAEGKGRVWEVREVRGAPLEEIARGGDHIAPPSVLLARGLLRTGPLGR